MDEKLTTEQAEKLLEAIFDGETDADDYPDTMTEKAGYAEYVVTHSLQDISKAIVRLSRLHHLLRVGEKDGGKLPDIIAHNETRMALEPLMRVERDISEMVDMLKGIYHATKEGRE